MTGSVVAYLVLVLAVAAQRLAELSLSRRHERAARARGGYEVGRGHYPVMVVLHTALLLGCIVEVVAAHRPFLPWLGWPMLVLLAAAQAVRVWCIRTLGKRWTTRVLVVPGAPLVTTGPYRWLRHPNYLAVVVEGVALPLVHTAWITAAAFTVANLLLLRVRIRTEDRALAGASAVPGVPA